MILNYTEAKRELYKKYNLEYTQNRDEEKYYENIWYLHSNNCYIELYGYCWEVSPTNYNRLRYNRTPVLGRFYLNATGSGYFDEYNPKKPGKVKRTISGIIRYYAKTYLEAVEGYNQSVDKQVEHLRKLEDWTISHRLQ